MTPVQFALGLTTLAFAAGCIGLVIDAKRGDRRRAEWIERERARYRLRRWANYEHGTKGYRND